MVLVNFPEQIQVDLTGSEFEGSILAPQCDVVVAGGFVDGQSVVKSWSGAAKQKQNNFAGCIPMEVPAADEETPAQVTTIKTVTHADGSTTSTTTTTTFTVNTTPDKEPEAEAATEKKTEANTDDLEAKQKKHADEVGVVAKAESKSKAIVWDINADEPAQPAAAAPCKPRIHVVAAGESLTSISNVYATTVTAILPANPQLRNINELSIGDNIVIPCADDPFVCMERTYVIKSGDTLSQIAHLNGITLSDILGANPYLHDADHIAVDQLLNLPCPDADVFAQIAQDILTSLLVEKITLKKNANVLAPQ
jgi:LysM repeat protein